MTFHLPNCRHERRRAHQTKSIKVGLLLKQKKKVSKPELEKALLEWIELETSPLAVTRTGQNKAREISAALNIGVFSASCGWLSKFSARNQLQYENICGESNSVTSHRNSA